jgi:hypothetical protein
MKDNAARPGAALHWACASTSSLAYSPSALPSATSGFANPQQIDLFGGVTARSSTDTIGTLVQLDREGDRRTRCHDGLAVVGSSTRGRASRAGASVRPPNGRSRSS